MSEHLPAIRSKQASLVGGVIAALALILVIILRRRS